MRILRVITIIMAVVVLVGGGYLVVTSDGMNDAPVLECSVDGIIEATVATTDQELLAYVKAYDKQDGDLTDKIKVIRKNLFLNVQEKSTLVTFAVCDSDNNVTNVTRKMVLTDYRSPRISLSYDFVFPSGYTYKLAQYVSANDVIDGDLTPYVKLISSEFNNIEGEYAVNLKVSNSMADTTEVTFDAIVSDEQWFEVKIRLIDYAAYTTVGQQYDYKSQIERISYKNKDHKEYKIDNIKIDDSAVDYSKPGTYNVFYTITDGDEIVTKTRLLLIVTEG